jgi:hypothetical protein
MVGFLKRLGTGLINIHLNNNKNEIKNREVVQIVSAGTISPRQTKCKIGIFYC